MISMAKCVVFDFDGTLVESNEIKKSTFYKVVERLSGSRKIIDEALSLKVNEERYDVFLEIARRLIDKKALSQQKTIEEWADAFTDEYTKICEILISKCPEILGATDLLEGLTERKFVLFVNSATPVEPLKKIIELRSLDKYFTRVYGKPCSKIENLRTIMASNMINPNEIIVIGDGESDRLAADATGCHFIGMLNDSSKFKTMPAYTVRNLLEAKEIIIRRWCNDRR